MIPTTTREKPSERGNSASEPSGWWRAGRYCALGAALAAVPAMFWAPGVARPLVTNVVVPLIPAVLLVNPLIWRNLCPLATANLTTSGVFGGTRLAPRTARWMLAGGVVLFLVLVPARHVFFNQHARALGVALGGLILVAMVLGIRYDMKSGFCNTLCPLLPVERLYGANPLIAVSNQRCFPRCNGCSTGCIDISPRRAPRQAVSGAGSDRPWYLTVFGAFVLAFPGFVLGYFSVGDGTVDQAVAIYGNIFMYTMGSFVVLGIVTFLTGASVERMIPFSAATAAAGFYWYAAPTMGTALGLSAAIGQGMRVAMLALVACWLIVALRRQGGFTGGLSKT